MEERRKERDTHMRIRIRTRETFEKKIRTFVKKNAIRSASVQLGEKI